MQVHLIDGTYELFRAFFGAPSALSPEGIEVGATRALARSLLLLIRKEAATHVAVAFDTVIESFRNELFEGYKTGEGIDPSLHQQFELAEQVSRALGFVTWSMHEFEADDALATAAHRFGEASQVERVLICTPDKDLCQCVQGTRIISQDRRRGTTLDAEGVREKFGVPPQSIPDWLALVGDSADGIPGIPKWGAKSSATVLSAYPHLEQIPHTPSEWTVNPRGAKGLSASLEAHRQDALLYRKLATLRTDVPLQEDLHALEYQGADRSALTELCERLGDMRLLERVPRFKEV